ncbi:putative enzyme related to lactoylglutathione lyase [Mycobacterium frederiksbergense]|uniref:Enzyme related to lactoylglutathione lyase n=1 Tax=Mycolicibacterium frederiksbergense TaxID=117567 RepID=A0ABT6L679_9MYCO|nr:VOC family protein [Mycolicibacterium frederiksbergense]MDH6198457.1 putative enzyme related to lactoylglutathione lyase [Mycolicibacterium frederiksbergense]
MVTRQSAPLGAPNWIDLSTSDVERSRQFYGAVFGWTFETGGEEYGGYVTASVDGRVVAGLMRNDPQWNAPDAWTTYLHTADADATVAAATAAGGKNCVEVMDIPAKGRMAMLTDPDGAFFGIWQPGGHDGFEVFNEAGAPVYHQLTTRDYAGSLQFYRTVFGWTTQTVSDTDEFRYSTAVFDGAELLGVMDGSAILPEGIPSSWNVFLGSDDVDKTIELVVANGGSALRAAEDTPYGRLAAVTDATGAAFNLSSLQG